MKATKEFFESLREEINASSPVVTEIQEQPSTRKLRVIDLFAGVGGLDLSNAELQCAFTKVEAEMSVKDAEIENLKAQLQTRASEMAVMKSQLEMQRIEYDAREFGVTPEELRTPPAQVPPEVQAQWDAEFEADMNRAEDEPEAYSYELIQMLEEAKERRLRLAARRRRIRLPLLPPPFTSRAVRFRARDALPDRVAEAPSCADRPVRGA